MIVGSIYEFKHQCEENSNPLRYVGREWGWHQLEQIDKPGVVWSELSDQDLKLIKLIMSQETLNKQADIIRKEFDERVKESGLNQKMFIAIHKEAAQILGQYEILREHVSELGFSLPPLLEGVEVSLSKA